MKFQKPLKGGLPVAEKFDISWIYAGRTNPVTTAVYLKRLKTALSLVGGKYNRTLELGTGCGILIPTLGRNSEIVYALDNEDRFAGLRRLCEKEDLGNVFFVKGDIGAVPFKGRGFDLIVSISVLEHVKDIDNVLLNIRDLLAPEGRFLGGYPVEGILTKMAFRFSGMGGIVGREHVSNHRKIKEALKRNFTVEKVSRMPGLFPDSFTLYEAAVCKV